MGDGFEAPATSLGRRHVLPRGGEKKPKELLLFEASSPTLETGGGREHHPVRPAPATVHSREV